MNVRKLMEFLQTVDPELDVVIYVEEHSALATEVKLGSLRSRDDQVEISS